MSNTKRGGKILYKCRLCDEVGGDSHAPDGFMAIINLITQGKTPEKWGIVETLLSYHDCTDGRIGIADLVGCELDEVKP